MIQCPRCSLRISEPGPDSVLPMECPQCGQALPLVHTETWEAREPGPPAEVDPNASLIAGYFKTVWTILSSPTFFFRNLSVNEGLSKPLAFALVTHWLGSALGYLWSLIFGIKSNTGLKKLFELSEKLGDSEIYSSFHQSLSRVGSHEALWDWYFGMGSIMIDPFSTLFSIIFVSFFVWLGARILVSPPRAGNLHEITYESAVRVVSFGLTPSLFLGLPLIGGFVSSLYVLVITAIGAREVYRVKSGRAIVIALFPKLLLFGIMGIGLILFVFVVLKVLSSFI